MYDDHAQGLYHALCTYAAKRRALFCMPGHKGRFRPLNRMLRESFDMTETPYTDALFTACSVIAQTERKVAAAYGARHSFLSAGGATACIQAMLASVAEEGDRVVLARNCHVSALNACAMLGIEPVWAFARYDGPPFHTGMIEAEEIEKLLIENPGVRAVFLTSPDYCGTLLPLRQIARVCKAHGAMLCVDNAHGAHLHLVGRDLHPLSCGADLCCDSAHKTLPALTGGAFLHCQNDRLAPAVKQKMALFASTSPSYLIMTSLDLAADYLTGPARGDYQKLAEKVSALRSFAGKRGYHCFEGDPVRFAIRFAPREQPLYSVLDAHGVEPEYCGAHFGVFIPTPFNRQSDFKRLERALDAFAGLPEKQCALPKPPLPGKKICSLRQALFAPQRAVPVCEAAGLVAASPVCICPPGVTPVAPGEIINENCVEFLKEYGVLTVNVVQ